MGRGMARGGRWGARTAGRIAKKGRTFAQNYPKTLKIGKWGLGMADFGASVAMGIEFAYQQGTISNLREDF